MAADPERAAAIEGSVARTLRYAADELSSGPDRTASKLQQAETQLASSDAKEHLSEETIAKFRAQIADLQKQVEAAERAETAGRIERELKRVLSGVEDEIRNNGSQIESYIDRAATKLAAKDAREFVSPETIAALQHQLDELRAKAGLGTPPLAAQASSASGAPTPTAPAPSAPAPSVASPSVASPGVASPGVASPGVAAPGVAAPGVAAPSVAAPSVPPPSTPAASASAPAQAEQSEDAQRTKNSIARILRLALGEIDAPGWRQVEGYIGQATTQIESDSAKQHLTPTTLDGFRAQVREMAAKFAALRKAERIEETEEWLQRLVRDAEQHVDWADRIGGMLDKVTDVLDKDETKAILPADRAAFYRKEVARIEAAAGGSYRQKAIDDAMESLEELERGVTDSSFDGLDEYEAQKVWGGFETFKDRVGYALEKLPADDATAREIRTRLDAALERRSAAYGATRSKAVMEHVAAAWERTRAEIAGWENESQDTSAAALGEEFLPNTQTAVRKLRDTISGSSLFSPIPEARKEYANDPLIVKVVSEGERMIEAGVAKMIAAFDAIMDAAEQMPTPTGEFELRKANAMAQKARDAFEGTPHADARVTRAKALDALWESTLERAHEETKAYYEKVSAEAANAWPAIASAVKAEDGFNPSDPEWRGKTVRINGFRNRVGWDFGGEYHLAIWVNGMPVTGDFEPNVLMAFQTAQRYGRLPIDDHTDWDAIVVVGGGGKVKQRFKMTVKKDGTKLGEIEEWRPVDSVMCSVIALRAGPVAVGPQLP